MHKPRILVVEDESIIAKDLQITLQKLGYDVPAIAVSGEEALKIMSTDNLDLIIMDIVLRGEIDGIETAQQAWSRFKIPVIFLTSYSDEKIIERAKQTEPFGYIIKPYDERELKRTIEMAIYKATIESKLKESEEYMRILFEFAPDGYFLMDLKGHFLNGNKAAENLIGYSKEEFIGKSYLKIPILPISDIPKIGALLAKMARGLAIGPEEFTLIRKDKTRIPVEIRAFPVNIKNQIVVLGIARDISERKKAEQDHHSFSYRLKELVEARTAQLKDINYQLQCEINERTKIEEKLEQSLKKTHDSLEGIIKAITMIVEMKDPYTAGHQRRVSNLASAIADKMGLTKEQIDGIRLAALIHDIGKIHVPAEILIKPCKLTLAEFTMIKTHSQIGFDILNTIEFPWPLAQIVLQHHERLNGSGYPYGITMDKISIEAKILMVADVIEAMASHRPYRPALGIQKAIEEISTNRDILYDGAIVDACILLFTQEGFRLD